MKTPATNTATIKNAHDAQAQAVAAKVGKPKGALRELKEGRDNTRTVTKWERYQATQEAADAGSFGTALDEHGKSPAWAAFARETFSRLYDSGMGNAIPDAERPMGSDWVSQLHESADALPEWRALQERSRRDAWASGVAAGEALRVLAQTVKPPESDPQAIADEITFVRELVEGGTTSQKHLRKLGTLQRRLKDAQEDHARSLQQMNGKAAAIRSQLRGAAQAAKNQIEEFDGAMNAIGAGDGAGITSRINAPVAAVRASLMKNSKLRRILKRAGRMKASAIQKQRNKATHAREELCDVHPGSDLARLLPVEMINLAMPETESLLYRKLIEGTALTYELRGKESRTEGPIIIAVDESGSMSGEPDEWAKSVAMALMEIAARQNRPFAYVHFDSQVSRVDEVPSPRSLTLQQMEELATYFHGGGTYIGAALDHCATMIETAAEARKDKPWKRADVILITDGVSGDAEMQNKAIDRIHKLGGHLFSVFIGCEGTGDPCSVRCDEKMTITHEDIRSNDPSKLGAMFSI